MVDFGQLQSFYRVEDAIFEFERSCRWLLHYGAGERLEYRDELIRTYLELIDAASIKENWQKAFAGDRMTFKPSKFMSKLRRQTKEVFRLIESTNDWDAIMSGQQSPPPDESTVALAMGLLAKLMRHREKLVEFLPRTWTIEEIESYKATRKSDVNDQVPAIKDAAQKGNHPASKTEERFRKPYGWWKSYLLPKLEEMAEADPPIKCPTRQELAVQFDTSSSTVQKCFTESDVLRAWKNRTAITVKATGAFDKTDHRHLSDTEVAEALQCIENQMKNAPQADQAKYRKQLDEMDPQKLAETLSTFANADE